MKHAEIKKCSFCDSGVAHSNQVLSSVVRIDRMVVDLAAVKRQQGLEMMMGGGSNGAALASIMGPNEDLLKPLGLTQTFQICDQCAMSHTIASLWELKP